MAGEAGQGCASRGSTLGGYTWVSESFPASVGGSVTLASIYAESGDVTQVGFAFYTADGNDLTTTDFWQSGASEYDLGLLSCEEFVDSDDFTGFNAGSGEYTGAFVNSTNGGKFSYSLAGSNSIWRSGGTANYLDVTGQAFTQDTSAQDAISIDITAAGGPSFFFSKIFGVNMSDVAEIYDIDKSNVAEIYGVPIA